MKKLKVFALVLLLLGSGSLALHYAVLPLEQTFRVSEMTKQADGLYSTNFSPFWPLKINKRGLAETAVTLGDGTELPQFDARIALVGTEGQLGFFINRPDISLRLPAQTVSNAEVTVVTPVKLRQVVHQVFLSLFALLGLWMLLRNGISAFAAGQSKTMLAISGASLIAVALGAWILIAMQGLAVWLGFGLVASGSLGALAAILRAGEQKVQARSRLREMTVQALLVAASLSLCLTAAEAYLGLAGEQFSDQQSPSPSTLDVRETWFQLPDQVTAVATARANALTLPKAWERRPAEIAGATSAYHWHDALHIHDINGFRRLDGPFTAKSPDKLRIMVVGDSLTYGYGVQEQWTYSRLLESALQEDYGVEVINLGRSGYQSTDILNVVTTFAPQLAPDLIVYGVCLNDFLPSGQGEYSGGSFPLPEDWKEYLLERTELAKLVNDGYYSLLLMAGLKNDFFDDILSQGTGYRERFARDVAEMNRFAEQNGLPPAIGIVFHQYLAGDQRAWELVESAEASMEAAGFDLISIKPWRTKPEGKKNFPVSRWEGHPNELAHSLLAEALYKRLISGGYLAGYETALGKALDGRAGNAN